MQATWSQPVAEVVVFSNDFAGRRARPGRPCAAQLEAVTSTATRLAPFVRP